MTQTSILKGTKNFTHAINLAKQLVFGKEVPANGRLNTSSKSGGKKYQKTPICRTDFFFSKFHKQTLHLLIKPMVLNQQRQVQLLKLKSYQTRIKFLLLLYLPHPQPSLHSITSSNFWKIKCKKKKARKKME